MYTEGTTANRRTAHRISYMRSACSDDSVDRITPRNIYRAPFGPTDGLRDELRMPFGQLPTQCFKKQKVKYIEFSVKHLIAAGLYAPESIRTLQSLVITVIQGLSVLLGFLFTPWCQMK